MAGNHASDVQALIRKARKQGAAIGVNGRGHVTFSLPGQQTVLCSRRPGSAKAITSLKVRLRSIGLDV